MPVDRMAGVPLPDGPLVGREAEAARIGQAITGGPSRLLTITGPPGVGKTRLALAVAHEVAGQLTGGAVFVDLVPVHDPQLAADKIARAVGAVTGPGAQPARQLPSRLRRQETLVVLDNCEHVADLAPELSRLLAGAPRLRVLATSRERLQLAAEREHPLPPLEMPNPHDVADLDRLARVPSVALLLDRARAVRPDLALTRENASAIAELCVRLDGLPLTLELAAARLKIFSPAELVFRLEHRLMMLAGDLRDVPARHRTLRAAIAWSHDLLTPAERQLFRRLSVFVGGWTLPAAEHVCGLADDTLAVTASLVDRSLVRPAERRGQAEFSMLESLREYAADQLSRHGEVQDTRMRHATYFADLAGQAEAGIGASDETFWWSWMGDQEANLGAAFEHSFAVGAAPEVVRLAGALGWHAYTRGHLGEGQAMVQRALRAGEGLPDAVLAGALIPAGILAWSTGDHTAAERLLNRALATSDQTGDHRRAANAHAFLGHVSRDTGRYQQAETHHREAGHLHASADNTRGVAWAQYDQALLARRRGDLVAARSQLQDALRRFREVDYPWAVACAASALGMVHLRLGAPPAAAELLVEAMAHYEEVADSRGVALCLEGLAMLGCELGCFAEAARLVGAAAGIRETLSAPLGDAERGELDAVDSATETALGAEAADRARLAGRTMPVAAAVALAREVAAGASRAAWAPTVLTGRERQVAALVAAGHTNRQIGSTLGIAEKTVEVHLHHIIGKLGAVSRAEVAAWAVTYGLHRVP